MPAPFVDNEETRLKLIEAAQRLTEEKLVVNQSGNVSVRAYLKTGEEGFLITPSGFAYKNLKPHHLVWMPLNASNPLKEALGEFTPSSEWELHKEIYLARKDANAIVHTHSLYATTLSISEIEIPAIHYMIASSGASKIPCAPYALFGSSQLAIQTANALKKSNCALMSHHGLVALGANLEKAFSLAIEIENLAHEYILLKSIGGAINPLTEEQMQEVFNQFKGYGQAKKR